MSFREGLPEFVRHLPLMGEADYDTPFPNQPSYIAKPLGRMLFPFGRAHLFFFFFFCVVFFLHTSQSQALPVSCLTSPYSVSSSRSHFPLSPTTSPEMPPPSRCGSIATQARARPPPSPHRIGKLPANHRLLYTPFQSHMLD